MTSDELKKAQIKFAKTISSITAPNGGPYVSTKWLMKTVFRINEEFYCPDCGEEVHSNNDIFSPECKCGWKGNMEDLIGEYEAKCKKRTKLIDRMTND
jgi:hypothetical protein